MELLTDRLRILPGGAACLEAEAQGSLGETLGANIPASWPPDLYDEIARRFSLEHLQKDPENSAWWSPWYLVTRDEGLVVGIIGFKGPPASGTVEIGYSVVTSHQRRGYATEACEALVGWALAKGVTRVQAQTLPRLLASIRVLEKAGFRFVGAGSEDGAILYEAGG